MCAIKIIKRRRIKILNSNILEFHLELGIY